MDDTNKHGFDHVEHGAVSPFGQKRKGNHVKSVLSVPLQEAISKQKPKIFTWKTVQLYYFMMMAMMMYESLISDSFECRLIFMQQRLGQWL